jgi:bidirectional [NiFe] hydrogenase diaphorase subunit
MPLTSKKPPLPSEDKRWRIVNGTMRRHGYARDALIETLHTVQESFGFLDKVSLRFVADSLRVPLSQAYGVATFYHFFTMKPPGEHAQTPSIRLSVNFWPAVSPTSPHFHVSESREN